MICMRAPVAITSSEDTAFTAACVPTGMNAGVSTLPCRVLRTPLRAAPDVASTQNEIK